ncbi:MAG TPA: universal stress protein [Candidatus Nitrosocosmicus sp.]
MAGHEGVSNTQTDILVNVLSIAEAILYYAKDKAIDLIVIGATGKTKIEKFLLGSVVNNVLKHAHCPVMVAR